MTDQHSNSPITNSSIGVVKFSQEKAGLPDVRKIAQEWEKDSGFKQIIVRKVSKDDYGIQFIYISQPAQTGKATGEDFSKWFMETFVFAYKEQYGMYAYDINHSTGDDNSDHLKKMFIKNEPITL
ncbi:hypothetical protein IT418_04090 [bacterium]|nr:hypothetical protein [bacterium]